VPHTRFCCPALALLLEREAWGEEDSLYRVRWIAMEKLLSTGIAGHQDLRIADSVWVKGTPSIASLGLARTLKREFRVHRGANLPPAAASESPSAVVCCLEGSEEQQQQQEEEEEVASLVRSAKEAAPDAAILVFSPTLELPLICAAVSAGARGFLHTGMPPHQLARALSVVLAGEMALPRELLEAYLNWHNEQRRGPNLSALSERQLEILELVVEGLSNAQIAKRLFVSESAVKQHLRAVYKVLGVRNRREAGRIVFQAQQAR
jgi:DNA-binding NarL/FixJ family response regulator